MLFAKIDLPPVAGFAVASAPAGVRPAVVSASGRPQFMRDIRQRFLSQGNILIHPSGLAVAPDRDRSHCIAEAARRRGAIHGGPRCDHQPRVVLTDCQWGDVLWHQSNVLILCIMLLYLNRAI